MNHFRRAIRLVTISIFSIFLFIKPATGAVPVPLANDTAPVDLGRLRVDNPSVISTSGTWRFNLVRGAMVDGKFVEQATYASASDTQADLLPDRAIDGKSDTRWCAGSAEMPQWWQLDLGKAELVAGINLSWEFSDANYKFKIELGPDEAHLTTVADQSKETGSGDSKLQWPATTARFVRVNIVGASDSTGEKKWASIREAVITVVRNGKNVQWSPPSANTGELHADDFSSLRFDDNDWHDIPVPSNWEVLGYSRPTYYGPDATVGLYRRSIDIPASFSGKKILWHFDAVTDSAEVWVNGRRIGYHEGGFTAFDMDVTSAVKPGSTNLLAVRVCKTTPSVDLDTGDYWLLGGIHRESYLVALPTDHVQDLTLVTKLDDKYRDASLLVDVKVAGIAGHSVSVVGKLFTGDGKPTDVAPLEAAGVVGSDGSVVLKLQRDVTAPNLWSAEKPNLYYLVLTLKHDDKESEVVQQRFGYRQIDIKNDILLWNGVQIKCTGTCRHEEWATVGHALTEDQWQTDVAMMKAANINAVRTSHYNHAERFLELCDEKGLYILDEIPACFVNPKDVKLKDAYVRNATETLNRDKNRPCVLAWSLGNESGWGPDFKAMIEYVAANDTTRPRFVSELSKAQNPNISFNDHHYSDDHDLRLQTTVDSGPSVITEGPHLFYVKPALVYDYGVNDLWGTGLAKQWDRIWPNKKEFGAFIWEWQDQGLLDKFPDKFKVDENGLRSENHKGLVTGTRVPKPELYHVKMVYSPVTTEAREVAVDGTNWTAPFTNRYAFTDLSEMKCHWQAMTTVAADHELASGEVAVACPPGETVSPVFPITPGADALRVSFLNANGVEVYATRLHVAGSPVPIPPTALTAEKLVPDDKPESVGVSAGKINLQIDRTSGQISIANGTTKIVEGTLLNLGELRADDNDALNRRDAPWIGSKAPPVLINVHVLGGLTGANAWQGSVAADVTFKEAPDNVVAHLTYSVTVDPTGHMDWSYSLKWLAIDMQAWDFGLKLNLPAEENHFSWYRKGQWTEYPPGHIGALQGDVSTDDKSFECTKRDTIWSAVTSSSHAGLVMVSTDTPLHTRCRSDNGRTTLFASNKVAPERSFSSGYCDVARIAFNQGHTYSAGFRTWITEDKRVAN